MKVNIRINILSYVLFLFLMTLFPSCDKEDNEIKKKEDPEKIIEEEKVELTTKTIEGVWEINGFENRMFQFSFLGDGTALAMLHGNTDECQYTVEKIDDYYYIRFDIPSVGKEKAKDYIVLRAKSFNGKDRIENVKILIEKQAHQADRSFTLVKKDIKRFDESFFDTSWIVTSNNMPLEKGWIIEITFSKNGKFTGLTTEDKEIVGSFDKKHFILTVVTHYNMNDFEFSFSSYTNKEKTKMEVHFLRAATQKQTTVLLEKKK